MAIAGGKRNDRGEKMIGDNMKRLMRENNYTQKELALRVGCTQASISSYINNKQRPGMKTLKNLAIALGVTVDELKEGGV